MAARRYGMAGIRASERCQATAASEQLSLLRHVHMQAAERACYRVQHRGHRIVHAAAAPHPCRFVCRAQRFGFAPAGGPGWAVLRWRWRMTQATDCAHPRISRELERAQGLYGIGPRALPSGWTSALSTARFGAVAHVTLPSCAARAAPPTSSLRQPAADGRRAV